MKIEVLVLKSMSSIHYDYISAFSTFLLGWEDTIIIILDLFSIFHSL